MSLGALTLIALRVFHGYNAKVLLASARESFQDSMSLYA
jgi:hypothetical protein